MDRASSHLYRTDTRSIREALRGTLLSSAAFTTPRETEQLCREAFNELVSDDSIEPAIPTRDHLFKVSERLLRERYRPLRRIAEAIRRLNSQDEWNSRKEQEQGSRKAPIATRLLRKMEPRCWRFCERLHKQEMGRGV